ncbi:MAG: ADP-ribose pyrophosphatase [Acidobacteriota bacterium]|jgi:ADP-ribose pyrophosphatase|nr:ADP-ribose pyrophosphatase [Acidobacteriota bacterium]MDT7777532.1 ADP-ribose pyrophosphatase [Acidobacteriota bacterium]
MSTSDKEQPEVLSSEVTYAGRLIEVVRDTVREGDKTYVREVVRHPGGAAVVPVFDDGTVVFVSQYRHPTLRFVLELPAGKLDPGESPAETAARELEEELGIVAGRMEQLSEFYTTPGFCAERLWVFLATDLRETARRHEEDEIIEVVRLPFARALDRVASGEIDDAKTIIGLLLAAKRLGLDGAVGETVKR